MRHNLASEFRFPRPELAQEMVVSLSGRQKWNSDADGLFLSAPRRTGKSTYLRNDLKPALEADGVEVIYLDLWANLQLDPTEQVYAAVSKALKAHGLRHAAGSSLTDAFRLLIAEGRRVALIIDEAQHLLVSERGDDVTRELKAARDTLNSPGDVHLMLVMSGSDRDKLGRLTNSKSAAFYGSRVRAMPLLDRDYIDWMCGLLAASIPSLGQINAEGLLKTFQSLGNRPRDMDMAISNALNPRLAGGLAFEEAVADHANEIVAAQRTRYRDTYLALTDIQRAVLDHLMTVGDAFTPFGAAAHQAYASHLGRKPGTPAIQKALNAMREMRPPLVWKSNWGEYALEDLGMMAWHDSEVAAGAWPPVESVDTDTAG
ncbi:ATP-binding protein [Bacillus sp. NP157]|nr:ATP-binding protein [Bacillus sp. NP157]